MNKIIIFTDLDGTLLNEESFSFKQIITFIKNLLKLDNLFIFFISSKTKENTILSTIKSIFNSEKLITYASIFLIILVCLYVIFRKRIKKYFKVRRLKKDTEKFNESFSSVLKNYELSNNINDLESLLLLWKRFMDKLTNKPYLSSTTNEISPFLKKKNLIMTLQEIDKNLYSNNKEIIKSNKLKDLKIEANNTSNKEVKRIENGK